MKKFYTDMRTEEFQIIVRNDGHYTDVLNNLDVLSDCLLEEVAIRYQEFMMRCGYPRPLFPLQDFTITSGCSVRKGGVSIYLEIVDENVVLNVQFITLEPSAESDLINFG